MKQKLAATTMLIVTLGVTREVAAETNIAHRLVERASATIQRFETNATEWEARVTFPGNPNGYRVSVIKDGETARFRGFIEPKDSKAIPIFNLTEVSNIWYVVEPETRVRCRPWEHFFQSAISELMLEAAELRFVLDSTAFAFAEVERTNGSSILFRERLDQAESNSLASVLAEVATVPPNLTPHRDKRLALQARFLQRALAEGVSFSVNRDGGFIDGWETQRHKIEIEHFHWLPSTPTSRLRVSGTNWVDRVAPFRSADWDRCVLVAHDPSAEASRINPRLGVLRLDNGLVTRVPIPTLGTVWGEFLSDRKTAVVVHQDIAGSMALSLVNLSTAEVTPLDVALNGTLIGMPVLSPDQQTIAILFRPQNASSVVEFQMLLVDIKKKTAKTLGKPGRLGAPYSWLPDGSGIVLKRFLPAKSDDIERRVVCFLRMDGTLADLIAGDDPLVIPHLKCVLFEGSSRDWFTCNLSGLNPVKFADGMKGWGNPAISPNGKEMLWVRFVKGELPQLHRFEFGNKNGELATKSPGFTSMPVW